MIRYTCPCSNVTVEAAAASVNGNQHLEKAQTFLDTNESTAEIKEVCANFLTSESFLQTKIFNSKAELDSSNSHLNAKYPLLIGTVSKSYVGEHSTLLSVNKCLICDTLTHIEFVQESTVTAETDTTKKSVLENRHFSDTTSLHSAPTMSRNLNTSTKYCQSILVNSKLMISHYDNDKLTSSDNYSSVYDILLDDKEATAISSKAFGDLSLKINEVPIFEQRRFLNQINEKYTLSHTTSAKEEVLKQKFETLVNCLLINESTNNKNNTSSVSTGRKNQSSTATSGIQLANRIQLANSEQRKARRKNDENLLSSSVFGMDEIDESEDEGKFLSDRDSQDEDEDGNQPGQKSVLKKRNSNIRDSDTGSVMDATKNIISKQQSFPHNKTQVSNQYSCSLPRDIPVMTVRQSMAKTYHKDYDSINNENYFNPSKEQQHTNPAQMVSGSYKQQPMSAFQNYNFSASNDDDDIFGDDDAAGNQQENFDIDEEDNRNLGEAISTLASSIVIKDGRELFGGVPSRRVPINSISKSCYE